MQKLMLARKGVQLTGYGRWLWTTTESVEGVKCDQVLPLPLLKGDRPHFPKEVLLLVGYLWMDLS